MPGVAMQLKARVIWHYQVNRHPQKHAAINIQNKEKSAGGTKKLLKITYK